MGKIYKMPFDWDYVDDNTLIYVDTSADGIKAMVDTALGEALDDVKAEVVDETISTMDIKLEGENLLYKLLVKGDDKGEINIPKDQFLKSASYDKDNKKLIFVMETTDGEKTTEVSISELVEAIEEKNSEQDASLDTKADKTEVDSALETINTKNTEQDAAIEEKAVKAEVDAALALKADKTELEPLAKSADVTAEIAAAVEPLATKEEMNAVDGKLADYASVEALNAEVERATAKENEVTEALNVEAQRATAAESELEGKVTAEQARAEEKEAELAAKDEELDAKKVDWTESDGGRKHIVLKNHDNILGTATDGGTYNLAMVSKWDVADFGSAQLHLNLNSKDAATINDDQVIATENVVDTKIEAAVSAINSKDEAQDAEIALKAVKADVDAALELKADKTELEPLAKSADVTAEIAAAVEPLATKEELTNAAAEAVAKVVAEAPEDFDTLKEVADYIAADKTKATEIENKLSEHDAAVEALNAKDVELNAAIVDEAERATAAESELTGKVVAEQARAEAKEAELVAKDEAQDAEIAKKVDWVESTPGRNHIVLKNHDSVLGTATDGSTYNLAMVSKWDVADFGSAQLHANLNSKDGNVTINDDKVVATKDEVEAVDAKVNAIDLTPFAKTEDMNAAVEALNAKDAELEAAIPQAAADAVAQVVANAPEDLDTLKEVADYIAADKTKATEIENKLAELTAKDAELVAKDEAQDAVINGKVDRNMNGANGKALIFNENDGGGAKFEHNDGTWSFAGVNDGGENGIAGQIYAVKKNAEGKMEGTRIDVTKGAMYYTVGAASAAERMVADNEIAVKGDVKAVNDKVDALEIPSIEGLAKSADVTAEIASAVSVLNTKDEAQDAEIALKADKTELEPLATKEEVANVDAKFADYATADALAQVEEKKVDWVESTPDRKHIVLKNHDSILGTATDGSTYNVAMVSKWDVADFGSAQLHLNLNSKDGSVTINDNKNIATEDYVSAAIDGLAKSDDVTAAIATAIEPLATKVEVESTAAAKANAEDVYTKTESDEKFQASGDYVPIEKYNDLKARLDNLEIMMSVYNAEREAQMDEIINNMSSDNKELVIDTLMESIVVPETTVAYTITAPLTDNSTVELTSPKNMTLINTSKEPVSTTISHTYAEGETTSATSVYLVGDFNTLTLENISPSVKSGYDAASVNNVVITENNVKNLTLALDFQDGATITNNSNANITIQDKNDLATTLTIVAPNSTVTLNGSNYEVVNATVSDNTLVIKKNVGHIGTLNVSKGNVIVEVARQSLIADKIGEYTLADGYTIDYLHDEIDSTNIANLTKEGTHVLVEDIEKSGNFSVGVLSSDELIWDLNGHSITSSNTRGYGIFTLRGSAKLEINDTVGTGVVKNTADEYGFWTSTVGSKVVINGGHFEASTHVLYAQKGTIEVNGGSFRLTNEDTADKDEFGNFKFLVNCHDEDYVSGDAKIIIRGGKFYGWNPSASYGEPGGPVSFVAEGYHVVENVEDEMKVYTVVADE